MKPLEPEEYRALSDCIPGSPGIWIDGQDEYVAVHQHLTSIGLLRLWESVDEDGREVEHWDTTEAGMRALRIHRAYLASMVTA